MNDLGSASSGKFKDSEYKSRYRDHDFQPRLPAYRPRDETAAVEGAMETTTTNKLDYVEHPLRRQQPVKPTDNNLQQQGDYDFTSSYNNTFQGQPVERVRPIRHDRDRVELDKFVGEPSYKAEFKEWNLPARHRREAPQWQPPQEEFDFNTTNKKDFREHSLRRREPIKRQEEWGALNGPFSDSTGYKDTFKEYELPARKPRNRQLWTQPAVKFDARTTKESDYTGPYQPRRESFRPDRTAFASNAPFDACTTNKADYQEKELGEKFVRGYQPYVKPEGRMDLSTTNQAEYKEFPISRNAIEKPSSSHLLRGTGPMATESGYAAEFHEYNTPRRAMLKPKNNYEPPSTKFEGLSTAKGDYVEKDLSPRETYRPQWAPVASDVPFENSTENRTSFVEKPLQARRRRQQELYVAPSVPFQASTTAKESYQGSYAPKRGNFKPDQTPMMSDSKFEGKTTFMSDFKEFDVTPRYRHEQGGYVKPEGVMDLQTVNRETFRDVGGVPRHVINRPGSSHVMRGEGKFEGGTSYAGDFVAPGGASRRLVKPKKEYHPSSEPFEGSTTQKVSFTGPYAPKQTSFKPRNRPLQNLNAFEDNPAHMQDYHPYAVTVQ